MSKRTKIVFAFLLAVILGLITYGWMQPREAVYQGKTLEGWLEKGTAKGPMSIPDENDVAAVQQFGEAAVPELLGMLRAEDSPVKRVLIKLARAQSLIPVNVHTAEDYHAMACLGFYALGPLAREAVPDLEKLFTASATEPKIRGNVADCLGHIGPDAAVAVPDLVHLLTDTNRITQWDSALNLSKIHQHPELAVPALIANLSSSNEVLATTIVALGAYGEDAKAAVPILKDRLNDDNYSVRYAATNALRKIEPGAIN